jgi:hypothetical protein
MLGEDLEGGMFLEIFKVLLLNPKTLKPYQDHIPKTLGKP